MLDYVIIDSDIVWYKDIHFYVNNTGKYYYAYSRDFHKNYGNTMFEIIRIKVTSIPQISGIAHHMAMSYKVLNSLKNDVMSLHGKPLWFMMLVASAKELTCGGRGI